MHYVQPLYNKVPLHLQFSTITILQTIAKLSTKDLCDGESGTVFTREQSAQFELSFELRNSNGNSNCTIQMIIQIAHFALVWKQSLTSPSQGSLVELSFKLRNLNYHSNDGILDSVYAKLHRDVSFEMRNSNDGPEVFSSYASLKSRSEIAVWMP